MSEAEQRSVQTTAIQFRPVKRLAAEVARKIAAGEVIDRPAAVLREFLDNAVDAGAQNITAELESGGISLIRVADNGCGMSKEDLQACARPHATSKIVSDTDLESLSTLGFRGEALASIAAVSRLEITSNREGEAWKTDIAGAERHMEPASLPAGTTVVCRGLFENFPARHRFLKRPQAENLLCKQIFIEKSLPFPGKAFRLLCDGKIKLDLSAGQSLSRRFCSALEMPEKAPLFYEIRSEPNGAENADSGAAPFYFSAVLGETSVYRSDRKLMYVFVNGRRVQEYALLQAIDYGAEGYFPNGSHPAACLFLTIDSSLVDFNIHPAKKEVRFKDIAPVHRAVSSAVRNFYKNLSVRSLARQAQHADMPPDSDRESEFSAGEKKYGTASVFAHGGSSKDSPSLFENDGKKNTPASAFSPPKAVHEHPFTSTDARRVLYNLEKIETDRSAFKMCGDAELSAEPAVTKSSAYTQVHDGVLSAPELESAGSAHTETSVSSGGIRYIGAALGVFLIAEKDDDLYLVDQHAGHERILFERFLESAGERQPLLIPLVLETPSAEDDAYLETLLPELHKAGFSLNNCGGGRWEVESVPVKWQGTERDLQGDLLDKRLAPHELIRSLAATSACRAAVKDGHLLDPQTARELLAHIFALEDPHCPHGRPVWTKISKDELFRAVRRTR